MAICPDCHAEMIWQSDNGEDNWIESYHSCPVCHLEATFTRYLDDDTDDDIVEETQRICESGDLTHAYAIELAKQLREARGKK